MLAEVSGCEEALRKLHDEAFQDRLRRLRDSELVDYPGVAAAKEEMLALLWHHFEQHELQGSEPRAQAFMRFMAEREATLGRHALFEALQAHLQAADPAAWGWPAWPERFRDPDGDAVSEFRRTHAPAIRYRFWLQWLADTQLESVQRQARSRGMGLGLYGDLAVGASPGGAETWAQPSLYALGMEVGAPPDPLNTQGQHWGLPPVNPVRLREARYAPFIEVLRANMRHSGALRLDHVMALMRLFWIGGSGGTYVSYPLQDLLGILALESHRHRCLVIGEDLGNVAPAMRDAMRERGLLSYRPLLFERASDGGFRPPAEWPRQALAVASTHDLPTLRGFWLGEDVELLAQLGLYADEAMREQAVLDRAQDRARLLLALEREQLLPPGATVQPTSVPDATPGLRRRRPCLAGAHAVLAGRRPAGGRDRPAPAGQRARHHARTAAPTGAARSPLRSRTWPATSASPPWPPSCAPSAAGLRPNRRRPNCRPWRPRAFPWPPTACNSMKAAASRTWPRPCPTCMHWASATCTARPSCGRGRAAPTATTSSITAR